MSLSCDEVKKAISQLNNDIYYEKLGSMMTRLRSWFSDKDKTIKQLIIGKTTNILENSTTSHQKLAQYSENVTQFMDQIRDCLISIGAEGENKRKKNNSNGRVRLQNMENISYFDKPKQVWLARKQGMKKIYHFSQILTTGVKKQMDQNLRLLSDLKNQNKKIRSMNQKISPEYLKKFQINSVRNNQKQFQINKIKEVARIYTQQISQYEQSYLKFLQIFDKLHAGQQYLVENLHSNMLTLSQIINGCFVGFSDRIILESEKFTSCFRRQNCEYELNIQKSQANRKLMLLGLKQNLQEINRQALQEISIASWTIQSKTRDEKLFSQKKGVITIDNKFLVLKDRQQLVESEINLTEAVIDESEHLGQLVLKPKKKSSISSRIIIKFEKPENEDQFKLHIQKAKGQIQ